MSPSTATNDKGYKKDLYEKFCVREYWIVDILSKSIDVYLLNDGKYSLDSVYSIYPDYILEKMTDDEKQKVITIITKFKTSLFNDLMYFLMYDTVSVKLEDVFFIVCFNFFKTLVPAR